MAAFRRKGQNIKKGFAFVSVRFVSASEAVGEISCVISASGLVTSDPRVNSTPI